jgi:hypothetical protein
MLAASVCTAAHAQLVVTNDGTANSTIWYIDLQTNNATAILQGGAEARAWGMAYDGGSNTLYWNNGGTLYSSAFSQGGLTPSSVALTFNGAATNFVGLAYANGRLLGTRNIATEAVYDINPITGEATLLTTYATAFDFGGLDSDGTRLYGINDAAGGGQGAGLYDIDINTGNTNFIVGSPAGDTDIDGLAIGGGRAYWVNDRGDQEIFVYNLNTNMFEASITNPILGSGIFSAGAYIPTPGVAGVLALGGIAALRRRR